MTRMTQLAMAVGLAWGFTPSVLLAQPTDAVRGEATQLDEITVSNTRTERKVDKVPSTVTVTPAKTIEQEIARDIKDIFRNEVDATARATPGRFSAALSAAGRAGNQGINIRGLEGNQVLMMIDGIRVPNSFSFGAFSTGRGDFIDVDGIKTLEILRGPASTQFGSDGLAGAVSFRTLDPSDLLKPGKSVGGFVRLGFTAIDDAFASTFGVAARSDQLQVLLQYSNRKGHETASRGTNNALNSTRTSPNPVDYSNDYLLGKALLSVGKAQQWGLSVEAQKRYSITEVYSARTAGTLTATSVLDLDANDRVDRDRVSIEHRFNDINAPWFQKAESRVFWQDATVNQLSLEDRNTAVDRVRDNSYGTKTVGLSTTFETNLSGWINQRLSYGFDWSRSIIDSVRSGTVPPFGEVFPSKPFPDTAYTLGGAFIQSEIESGALSIIPSLRYDRYQLTPSTAGYTGGTVVTLSGKAVTPRIGVVWQLAPMFAPFGQIAKGFRAPTPDQVNNGFTNVASGYRSIGNSALKAENANSTEVGFRGKLAGLNYSLTAFNNRYDNFISQQVVGGTGTLVDPTIFQYINLSNAKISGFETRADWRLSQSWVVNFGAAKARGDSLVAAVKTPIDTVQPVKFVLGVRFDQQLWGARLNVQHSKAKEPDRIAPAFSLPFAPPSYTSLDLGFYWKPLANLTINASVNNALDSKYWIWSDIRGLSDSSLIKDGSSAPGRNGRISIRYDF